MLGWVEQSRLASASFSSEVHNQTLQKTDSFLLFSHLPLLDASYKQNKAPVLLSNDATLLVIVLMPSRNFGDTDYSTMTLRSVPVEVRAKTLWVITCN